ncbi:MAG: HDOD domain-containing protein [Gammaproteobacteria bacterium]|jgi:HD-like signal output (HDOD) protein|nr:HDOD domain-containing protein [Gammaproteobacteria bacterium]
MDALVQSVANGIRSDLSSGRLVLPSLPDIVFQVARLLDDPGSSGEAIATVVGKDPALSARFLRLANSAYFPGMRPVADLRRAIVRLGHKVIKHLITTLAVSKLYDVRAHPLARPHLVELWQHSTLVASLSEVMTRRLGHLEAEVAMLAGLVHRIGALPVIVRAERTPQVLTDRNLLRELLAHVQREVGAAIVAQWRFPPELVAVVVEHEDAGRESPGLADYVDVVQVASLVAYRGTDHPWASLAWASVPATLTVGLEEKDVEDLMGYAGARVGELRRLLGPQQGSAAAGGPARRKVAG